MTRQRFAILTSIIFVPPVISAAVIVVLVLLYEHGNIFHQLVVGLTAILAAGGLQIVYVLYLNKIQQVSAWDVPEKEQRSQPYLVSAAISGAGMLVLLFLNASLFIWALLWCYTFNTLILYVINRYWKISAHLMGFAGPLVFLWPLLREWLLLALPLLILSAWARIETKSHSLLQVLAGAFAGVVLTLFQLWLLWVVVLPLFG